MMVRETSSMSQLRLSRGNFAHPFRKSFAAITVSAMSSSMNQEDLEDLADALDYMFATDELFIGKYELRGAALRCCGGQGCVEFAKCARSGKSVAIKVCHKETEANAIRSPNLSHVKVMMLMLASPQFHFHRRPAVHQDNGAGIAWDRVPAPIKTACNFFTTFMGTYELDRSEEFGRRGFGR